jgi:hypothetical protein
VKLKQKSEELSNVSLLIFLLVHFPQIFTINYNLVEAKFKLSFMLKINIEHETYIKFKKRFYECVRAYSEISNLASIPKINRKITKSWTLLQVTFNGRSITVEEVNLVSNLILSQFKNDVIIDTRNGSYLEMEKTNKEEFIEYLLSRKKENEENLLAFREAGKVYVFDK